MRHELRLRNIPSALPNTNRSIRSEIGGRKTGDGRNRVGGLPVSDLIEPRFLLFFSVLPCLRGESRRAVPCLLVYHSRPLGQASKLASNQLHSIGPFDSVGSCRLHETEIMSITAKHKWENRIVVNVHIHRTIVPMTNPRVRFAAIASHPMRDSS